MAVWPTDDEITVLAETEDHLRSIAMVVPRRAVNVRTGDVEHKCVQCGHVMKNHVWLATVFYRGMLPLGGHIWCPCKACPCHRSWVTRHPVSFDVHDRLEDMKREEAIGLGVPLR